jgi:hypothetical protein
MVCVCVCVLLHVCVCVLLHVCVCVCVYVWGGGQQRMRGRGREGEREREREFINTKSESSYIPRIFTWCVKNAGVLVRLPTPTSPSLCFFHVSVSVFLFPSPQGFDSFENL